MSKKPKPTEKHPSLAFRKKAIAGLIGKIGVYAICDLDGVPIYVGQSKDGIRKRVQRHLTSARSDIIATRMVDVWEIAYVKAWAVQSVAEISELEAVLFNAFDSKKALMNGSILKLPSSMPASLPEPTQVLQVMSDEDIKVRRDPMLRLPRQIEHIGRLVDYMLSVKDTPLLRRALAAHFERLDAYRQAFLKQGAPVIRAPGQADDEQ